MTLANNGDKHNFGQIVERIVEASGTKYRKPRTVYWEHLFFGINSPLKPFFAENGKNDDRALSDYLFNLDIQIDHPWLGFAAEVKKSEKKITDRHFYSFGVLLGYCFLFGIRDLHWGNLIAQDDHLQVVDAEVVLTNLHLPHETLLLPFKDIGFQSCGASLLGESLAKFSQRQKGKIFAGYFDVANKILDQRESILKIFPMDEMENQTIRVIIKNTAVYRTFAENKLTTEMLSEELAQLNRGDVPYFYKFLGNDALLFLSKPGSADNVSLTDEITVKDVQRHAVLPATLLGSDSVLSSKIAAGALYLLKVFAPDAFELKDGPIDKIRIGQTAHWRGREYKRC
jgi:lantibiotic modifying enzyme